MIQKDFYNIIKQTGLLHEQGEELKRLVSSFPYASSLQLLYTKSLKESDAIEFNAQLHHCAIKVSDRKRMYEFIHQQNLIEVINKIETDVEYIEDKKLDDEPEIVEDSVPVEQHLVVLKDETKEVAKEGNEEDQPKDDNAKANVDELEQLIISEAINYSIQNEVDSEMDEAEIIESETDEKSNVVDRKPRDFKSEKHSFLDWLTVSDKEEKEELKPRKDKELVGLVDSFLKNYERDKSEENKEVSFYSPENVARLSLVDSEEFVTETLANVYVKQGHFSKAIRIYEQLILKNPEKKTFFASRIRFLKEKQQYKND